MGFEKRSIEDENGHSSEADKFREELFDFLEGDTERWTVDDRDTGTIGFYVDADGYDDARAFLEKRGYTFEGEVEGLPGDEGVFTCWPTGEDQYIIRVGVLSKHAKEADE